ncbi:hypothetical protein GH714_000393 [Hevea brasiliensis]|uniref:Uncharacterized protein n=1 Tax=Hevea brasiliensis TaxID=3981 RepID=A0A6A6LXZ0_HEVBR|nr:hypothetical protein GH714_000393 [Hevea brasiliensis]
MVRNPSFPEPDLLSADELFVDGVLLPLHLLHLHTHHRPDPRDSKPDPKPPNSYPNAEPRASPKTITAESYNPSTASKRWRDIFKKGGASSAELNINIWPFSRSRSAGNSGGRPRMFPGAAGSRKVSSAPCSRSNQGELKSRKWPSSPGRGGVHVGRSSPVWQVRRGGGFSEAVKRSSERMKSKRWMGKL